MVQQQHTRANWSRLRQQQYLHQYGATPPTATLLHQRQLALHSTHLRLLVQHNTTRATTHSYVLIGYQGNTHLQFLVQQHLRHLHQRQVRPLRQQIYSLEGSVIRRHQVGLPNAHRLDTIHQLARHLHAYTYIVLRLYHRTDALYSTNGRPGGNSNRKFRHQIGYSYLYRSPLFTTRGNKHKKQNDVSIHGSRNTSSTRMPVSYTHLTLPTICSV